MIPSPTYHAFLLVLGTHDSIRFAKLLLLVTLAMLSFVQVLVWYSIIFLNGALSSDFWGNHHTLLWIFVFSSCFCVDNDR